MTYLVCWTDGRKPLRCIDQIDGPLWLARPATDGYGWRSRMADARHFGCLLDARRAARANDWPFSAGMLHLIRVDGSTLSVIRRLHPHSQNTTLRRTRKPENAMFPEEVEA